MFDALLAGLLRPFGPSAVVVLPLAIAAGFALRREARAWLLAALALALTLPFAEQASLLRSPSWTLRALTLLALFALALQRRQPLLREIGVALSFAVCAFCLLEVPGPRHSLLEAAWPSPIAASVRIALVVGSAVCLLAIAALAQSMPTPVRRAGIALLAVGLLVVGSGAASPLLAWCVARWPLSLVG